MSKLLQSLYDGKAFKPAPSLWELADAHVPLSELGVDQAPEPRVSSGLGEGDGVVLLVGRSGGGKSSVLAYVAAQLAARPEPVSGRRYLPIFVPVAGRPEAARDLDAFGRSAMREVLIALRDGLPSPVRERLAKGIAKEIAVQHSGPKFNAKLAAMVFGAGGEAGMEIAGDVTNVIGKASSTIEADCARWATSSASEGTSC